MTMGTANGTSGALEDELMESPELSAYGSPYASPELHEDEAWESPEASHYSPEASFYGSPELQEDEAWESPEAQYAGNPYSHEASQYSPEASAYSPELQEDEAWEYPESSQYSPYATEDEDELMESHEASFYGQPETGEADPFLPFLAPLALKALPMIGKFALPAIKKLLPVAKRAIGSVVKDVLGGGGRPGGAPMPRPGVRRVPPRRPTMGMPRPRAPGAAPRPAGAPRPGGPQAMNPMVAQLLQQLSGLLKNGETTAAEMEAQLFGSNEFQGEIAAHESAHEAALTEVLAAEASHALTESEAESLLGAALPVTIRIVAGRRAMLPLVPALVQANARLVRGIRRSSPAGRQLLRAVPSIQRRTVASLRAAQRSGRPVSPAMVAPLMAGQAARVLGSPHICGRALVRNTAIRKGTVAPAGRMVRPRA